MEKNKLQIDVLYSNMADVLFGWPVSELTIMIIKIYRFLCLYHVLHNSLRANLIT